MKNVARNTKKAFYKVAVPLVLGSTSTVVFAQSKPQAMLAAPASAAQPAADFVSSAPNVDAMHLMVGRSMYINTRRRLTRIYVSNPNVVSAYVASPNQVLVSSKDIGISSVVVWDESGDSQPYLISSDQDLDPLRSSLRQSLPGENVEVRSDGGRIVLSGVVGTPEDSDAAAKLAAMYSKNVFNALTINSAVVKQVRLKVRIVEVDRSKLTEFGFNFYSVGGNTLAQTTTSQFSSTLTASTGSSSSSSSGTTASVGSKTASYTNPLNFLLYNSSLNIGAMLQDMEEKQILQILAEPTITTISGKEASFLSGGEFPFPVVQGSTGGLASISIQFRPYGVKIDFTPVVNVDGTVQLKVAPEVSALDYTNEVSIDGYDIPAISTRRADTQVVLRSGQSFAISGLLDRRTTDAYMRTPGFSSIPILGQLFKSKNLDHTKTELVVIVTPEVVNPLTDDTGIKEPTVPVPAIDDTQFDQSLQKKKSN
ncbi:type II and III secretion system protein family protein [Silvibacterium sp.]|uniref:type II and III secretion system protein family protein n=1 Tax=Silvibacterium sp. TaxID=1964179 RepID=UPI0039E4D6AE